MPNLIVTNDKGRSFTVRIVRKGDRYGLNDCLTHNKAEPLVEFYDLTYTKNFGPLGQFVSRYYLDTIADIPLGQGIDLMGYEPVWKIDGPTMQTVIEHARRTRRELGAVR
jgi:hypothetical protein